MLIIRDTSTVPPETWSYEVAEAQLDDRVVPTHTIKTRNYQLLYPMVSDYCQANGLPIPGPQEVIDQMCERLHIPCVEQRAEGNTPLINKMGLPFVGTSAGCCSSTRKE